MNGFDPTQTASELAKDFYASFDATPDQTLTVSADDILARRDVLLAWSKNAFQILRPQNARAIESLYKVLKQKISNGSIGQFIVLFQHNDSKEAVQDRHPLLRVIDFAARKARSFQAYAYNPITLYGVGERVCELGDKQSYYTDEPMISPLFLDVENHQKLSKQPFVHFVEAVKQAIAFEDDVAINALDPNLLAANPGLLRESFDRVVGEYRNGGMAGVYVDVPALMKWELIADRALKALSLEDLKTVYKHYQDKDGADHWGGGVTRVIKKEIESICMSNAALKKHLEYGAILDETRCDVRVMHLVAERGRYPANIDEAFAKAIDEQQSSDPSATRPTASVAKPPRQDKGNG